MPFTFQKTDRISGITFSRQRSDPGCCRAAFSAGTNPLYSIIFQFYLYPGRHRCFISAIKSTRFLLLPGTRMKYMKKFLMFVPPFRQKIDGTGCYTGNNTAMIFIRRFQRYLGKNPCKKVIEVYPQAFVNIIKTRLHKWKVLP